MYVTEDLTWPLSDNNNLLSSTNPGNLALRSATNAISESNCYRLPVSKCVEIAAYIHVNYWLREILPEALYQSGQVRG